MWDIRLFLFACLLGIMFVLRISKHASRMFFSFIFLNVRSKTWITCLPDRWRWQTMWSSRNSLNTFYCRLASSSTRTGDHSTTSVNRATSTTTSSVITRHFIKTLSTFYDWYLVDASLITPTPFSFPPPMPTAETETRGNFCGNTTAKSRRKTSVNCCNCIKKIMRSSAFKFRASFAKSSTFGVNSVVKVRV